MPNPIATTALPHSVAGIRHWVQGGAMVVGFLLCGLAGIFPDRLQPAAVPLGIGLMLAGMVVSLAYSAREAGLQWRGISPAVGVLIGALPLLAPLGWRYFESPRHHEAAPTSPAAVRSSPRSATRASPRSPAPMLSSHAEQAQPSAARPSSESDDEREDRVRRELGRILSEQARPTIQAMESATTLTLRRVDPDTVRSRLEAVRHGLSELQATLDNFRFQNPSLSAEVLGDTTALSELDSELRHLSDLSGDAEAQRREVDTVRVAIYRANHWVLDCENRITGQRDTLESAP